MAQIFSKAPVRNGVFYFEGERRGVTRKFIQKQVFTITKDFRERNQLWRITAEVRFDDECKNGHESFAITGHLRQPGISAGECFGCIHDEVAKHFPELEKYIKWHLCSVDGPMHYIANTMYHASDKDHNGLRKGERKQLVNGRTKQPVWHLEREDGKSMHDLSGLVDADGCPTEVPVLRWAPVWVEGKGKDREFNHARSSAVWPEATDEQLMDPNLKQVLEARLPELKSRFKADMLELGFEWPEGV